VWGLGFGVEGREIRTWSLGFVVCRLRFWASGFGCGGWSFGFEV
jgi:hypothetical protein